MGQNALPFGLGRLKGQQDHRIGSEGIFHGDVNIDENGMSNRRLLWGEAGAWLPQCADCPLSTCEQRSRQDHALQRWRIIAGTKGNTDEAAEKGMRPA
jgi:hypothetical protein